MEAINLTSEQKRLINNYSKYFFKYVKSRQFSEDQASRMEHKDYFQNELPKKIDELSEEDIYEIVIRLWSSRVWGSKQHLVQKILSDNGIEKIRRELKNLLDKSISIAVCV